MVSQCLENNRTDPLTYSGRVQTCGDSCEGPCAVTVDTRHCLLFEREGF
jgi:hypothetical protein